MHVSQVQVFKNNYNLQKSQSRVNAHPHAVNNHGLTPAPAAAVFDCESKKIPYGFRFNSNVSFGEFFDPNRTVPHIDHEEYMAMKEHTKKRFRKRYDSFMKTVDKKELVDLNYLYLPLRTDKDMDNFIEISKIYNKYKEQPIICLGRSPKWFLNTSLWMKDGIKDYNFVAFSKYWYRPDGYNMKRMDSMAPTEKEEHAYRKYLKRIKADPQTIVDNMEKTGKKTVITDYICSGKGACSFLDVMSKYADDLGILDKFAKSIEIVGIGSMEYMEDLNPYADSISRPSVPMPEKLQPYSRDIKQSFYNMNYTVFKDMLLNQNTNECRSTYYPHETWTMYKPDQFKTGLIHDMKKVKEMAKKLKTTKDTMSSFSPAMYDFRNLLNFHILDGLNQRGLLKLIHKSKI